MELSYPWSVGVAVPLTMVTKHERQLKEEGFILAHGSRAASTTAGSPEAECEAADGVCSQEAGGMDAGARPTFSLLVSQGPLTQTRISATNVPRGMFPK